MMSSIKKKKTIRPDIKIRYKQMQGNTIEKNSRVRIRIDYIVLYNAMLGSMCDFEFVFF